MTTTILLLAAGIWIGGTLGFLLHAMMWAGRD